MKSAVLKHDGRGGRVDSAVDSPLKVFFLYTPCFRDQTHHFRLQLISLLTDIEDIERGEKKTAKQTEFSV